MIETITDFEELKTFVGTVAVVTILNVSTPMTATCRDDVKDVTGITKSQFNNTVENKTMDSFDFSIPKNSELQKIQDKIYSFLLLEDGWDGYYGVAPSQKTVDKSLLLLDKILNEGLKEPQTMLSSQGEIGFYWRNKSKKLYVELGIEDENEFSYYINNNDKYTGADVSLDRELPNELIFAVTNTI